MQESKGPINNSTSGFTLIELMVASAVFAVGMVVVLGGIVSLFTQSAVSDSRVAAVQFHESILDQMRQLERTAALNYTVPLPQNADGTVHVPGLGDVNIIIQGVIPAVVVGDPPTFFTIPMPVGFDATTVPQVYEVQIQLDVLRGPADGTYTMAGMIG